MKSMKWYEKSMKKYEKNKTKIITKCHAIHARISRAQNTICLSVWDLFKNTLLDPIGHIFNISKKHFSKIGFGVYGILFLVEGILFWVEGILFWVEGMLFCISIPCMAFFNAWLLVGPAPCRPGTIFERQIFRDRNLQNIDPPKYYPCGTFGYPLFWPFWGTQKTKWVPSYPTRKKVGRDNICHRNQLFWPLVGVGHKPLCRGGSLKSRKNLLAPAPVVAALLRLFRSRSIFFDRAMFCRIRLEQIMSITRVILNGFWQFWRRLKALSEHFQTAPNSSKSVEKNSNNGHFWFTSKSDENPL